MDNKRRLYRLIENYINDFKGDSVKLFYGEGSYIKIHNINFGISDNSVMIEVIVLLGGVINEDILDTSMAEVLVSDCLVYFFPDQKLKLMVRWDV